MCRFCQGEYQADHTQGSSNELRRTPQKGDIPVPEHDLQRVHLLT